MIPKYWYIDDSQERNNIARGLINLNKLKVEAQMPNTWQTIISETQKGSLNGLLLDWQLQREEEAGDYSSASLAQHLRVLATEGSLTDLPIVLCSAQDGFTRKYKQDLTTHDLFDMVYHKDDLSEDHTQDEFIALANGYKELNKNNKMPHGILGISEPDYARLDIRFQAEFKRFFDLGSPAHQIAQFLLREVLEYQGILIDEDVLAARLGVAKSSPDWEKLKAQLDSAKYKGVFGDAWERWWWFEVEKWCEQKMGDISLQNTSSTKRVNLLKNALPDLQDLVPASPTEYSNSDDFWTVCYATKKPLDYFDGFKTNIHLHYEWQEPIYVSNFAVLEYGSKVEGKWELSPTEINRFEEFKNRHR